MTDEPSQSHVDFSDEHIVSEFERLGLSQPQSRVFFSILKLGSGTAGEIAKNCSMDLASTYHKLIELVKMDLLELRLGKPNTYVARDISSVLKLLIDNYKSELDSRAKISRKLAIELSEMRNELPVVVPKQSGKFRLVFNRAQAIGGAKTGSIP